MKHTLCMAGLLCLCISVRAQQDSMCQIMLNEVVVSGFTGKTKLNETPFPVTRLNETIMREKASGNVIDAIAKEPGVSQISTGGGISKPVIRGLGYNRVVVVADGIRQEGQQWGDEHGVEVDANTVASAEILKGPASLMYGSDALAGVVILYPDTFPAAGEYLANFSGEYQTNSGLAAYSLNHSGNAKDAVWSIRYSDKYAHAYRNAADGSVPGSQFRERSLMGRTGIKRNWGHSFVTLGCYLMKPGMIEGFEDGQLLGEKGYSVTLPYQRVCHYKAVSDNSFSLSAGTMDVVLGYQRNRRQEFEESADEAELDFKLQTLNYDIKYISKVQKGWKYSCGLGGMFQMSDNLGEEALIPAYRLLDAGLFLTTQKRIGKFHFSGGVRGDVRMLNSLAMEEKFEGFNRTFAGLTGSFGVVYALSSHWNFRVNVARGFRAPNLSELASNGVHEGTLRYECGNKDLHPEFSLQEDLGVTFSSAYFSAKAAVFCNKVDDYIYAQRTGDVIDEYQVYAYTSCDALLYGTELSVEVNPYEPLFLDADFSFVRGTFAGADLPMIPAPEFVGEVKWEFPRAWKVFDNCKIGLNVKQCLEQNHFLVGTETKTNAYTLLGASASVDIVSHAKCLATISLLADNLTDAVYFDHLSRLKHVGVHNAGRNLTMKLNIYIK